MEERRAAQRHRTLKGARIAFNGGQSTISCMVRNLSDIGALLQVDSVVGVPEHFDLLLSDGRAFHCWVSRRTATELGVSFLK
jgi:hypothetical protein